MKNRSSLRILAAFPLLIGACSATEDVERESMTRDVSTTEQLIRSTPSLDRTARERIAEKTGITANRLEIVAKRVDHYASQRRSATHYKVLNKERGEIHGVALEADGTPLEPEVLFKEERSAMRNKYGALDPATFEALEAAPAGEPVSVTIWLKEPSGASDEVKRPKLGIGSAAASMPKAAKLRDEANNLHAAAVRQRASAIQAIQGVTSAKLKMLDPSIRTVTSAPMIHARLRPSEVKNIARWSEIDHISFTTQKGEALLASAGATTNVSIVRNNGLRGAGVKVGVIEIGGRINTDNPYVRTNLIQDTTYTCPSLHALAVTSILHSSHPTETGVAPDAQVWLGGTCEWDEAKIQDQSMLAVNWGASVLNLSIGSGESYLTVDNLARFYDELTINYWRTVVVSAGNGADDGNVESPALAYNVIAVGAFEDKNTASWSDDTMWSSSSYRNPYSTGRDREKPEIVAPGTQMATGWDAPPWAPTDLGPGTSAAAPMVAGTAALMIQANADLRYWPEAVKAILMASAVHNIEGDARLSDRDGAGGLVADAAVSVAQRSQTNDWGVQAYDCNAPKLLDIPISVTAGKRTRVALVWDNNPAYAYYVNRPSADLDLLILNSQGETVTSSSSSDNTFEIVDFTPSTSGTYKLRIDKFRCDLTPKYLGWAVFKQ